MSYTSIVANNIGEYMSLYFTKSGQRHIAVISKTYMNYKCIGNDFTYRTFSSLDKAISFMEAQGYRQTSI